MTAASYAMMASTYQTSLQRQLHELCSATTDRSKADARNFVLCPGDAYDRSPCGTGTSAKLACLYEDGKLAPDEQWRQEGITGSLFYGFVQIRDGLIYPHVRGRAFVTMHGSLVIDDDDAFAWGIQAHH